jgi:hypothetical protein
MRKFVSWDLNSKLTIPISILTWLCGTFIVSISEFVHLMDFA